MARTHKHFCATKGCKAVVAVCSAPQDYDGSPNCCTDEAHYDGWLCEDCYEVQKEEDAKQEALDRAEEAAEAGNGVA